MVKHPISKTSTTLNVLDCVISCSYTATFCPINRDEHNEVDNVKQSKAWSEPHPKKKKVCYITLLFGIISPNQYASQPTPFMNLLVCIVFFKNKLMIQFVH